MIYSRRIRQKIGQTIEKKLFRKEKNTNFGNKLLTYYETSYSPISTFCQLLKFRS